MNWLTWRGKILKNKKEERRTLENLREQPKFFFLGQRIWDFLFCHSHIPFYPYKLSSLSILLFVFYFIISVFFLRIQHFRNHHIFSISIIFQCIKCKLELLHEYFWTHRFIVFFKPRNLIWYNSHNHFALLFHFSSSANLTKSNNNTMLKYAPH